MSDIVHVDFSPSAIDQVKVGDVLFDVAYVRLAPHRCFTYVVDKLRATTLIVEPDDVPWCIVTDVGHIITDNSRNLTDPLVLMAYPAMSYAGHIAALLYIKPGDVAPW